MYECMYACMYVKKTPTPTPTPTPWLTERQDLVDKLTATSAQTVAAEASLAAERQKKNESIGRAVIPLGMQWQYDSGQSLWCSFAMDANEHLLKAYMSEDRTVDIRSGGKMYTIDFALNEQVNVDTKKRRMCKSMLP